MVVRPSIGAPQAGHWVLVLVVIAGGLDIVARGQFGFVMDAIPQLGKELGDDLVHGRADQPAVKDPRDNGGQWHAGVWSRAPRAAPAESAPGRSMGATEAARHFAGGCARARDTVCAQRG